MQRLNCDQLSFKLDQAYSSIKDVIGKDQRTLSIKKYAQLSGLVLFSCSSMFSFGILAEDEHQKQLYKQILMLRCKNDPILELSLLLALIITLINANIGIAKNIHGMEYLSIDHCRVFLNTL